MRVALFVTCIADTVYPEAARAKVDSIQAQVREPLDFGCPQLVVYTTDTTWTMPRDLWTLLAVHTRDMPDYLKLAQRLFTSDANVRNVKAFFSVKRAKFETRLPLPAASR